MYLQEQPAESSEHSREWEGRRCKAFHLGEGAKAGEVLSVLKEDEAAELCSHAVDW